MSSMILVLFVLFVSSSSSSFLFVEGGIMTGFQRDKMPVNVEDVVHTFERAERYFQRHLQQEQQAQEMEIPVVVVNNAAEAIDDEEEFDPFNNPTNADPPSEDGDVDDLEEDDGVEDDIEPTFAPTRTFRPTELPVATTNIVFLPVADDAMEADANVAAAATPTVTTTNVMIGNPEAVAATPTVTTTNVMIGNPDVVVETPTVTTTNIKIGNPVAGTPTTATTTTSIKLGTTVHDDANPPSFNTKITTTAHPTVSPTTKKPTKKPSKAPTPKPYHDHANDVMKFKDIQVSRQQTGPRGGKKDPSPNIQPTELSFMIIMDDYNYSNDAETTHDIGIGTKFAFTGRIVTKAEELGTAVGTCTVTSEQNMNLSYCEVFHKISTDNYGGFGIVHTAGTADEVGGRFLITGTGGSLSKDAATDQGYAMVQFDPAGNPVLYVLLKLF